LPPKSRGSWGAESVHFHLNDLQILETALMDRHTDDGAHFLPALLSGSARIDVQDTKLPVEHDLEDMGVAVYRNECISPGDGGLALGQAYLAAKEYED